MKDEQTLHLILKKKWFDMILSGEKKEEYRDITPFWKKRIADKDFDTITFTNGYNIKNGRFKIKVIQVSIGEGYQRWGAIEGKEYYVIRLGDIVDWRSETNK